MKPYPAYKDSGVEWLGEVPEGWSTGSLRQFTSYTVGWTPPTDNEENFDGEALWANISDLNVKTLKQTAKQISSVAIAERKATAVPGGSLLFSFKLSVGAVAMAGRSMYTNEAIAAFQDSELLLVGYAYYAFPILVSQNSSFNIYGARLLNQQLIRSAPLVVPPLVEQKEIAAYLDRETAQIDELIGEQEAFIEALAERRLAVVTEAIKCDVEQPVSRNFSVVLGKMLDAGRSAKPDDEVLPYLRALNIQDAGLALDSVNEMPFTAIERSTLDLRGGDLLVVEGGAGVANTQVLDSGMLGWSFQKTLNRVRPTSVRGNTRFLAYVLRVYRDSGYLDVVCNKSTIPHLTAEKLLALRVPQPAPAEQARVVEYLDEQTSGIDVLMAECRELITLLKERRSALISAAVTGKVDVRTA